ncbi:putative nucleic acid-binding protein, consists of a PIN domain and a Zn-ribbon module [Archaeoglobus sulfaticallidus PM70-1]|uniref:Endoribonuclease Nob1 n=1 Tax=Archaeoglobus sulfaticallidus PM70-1 TaxID=387631 RepID=N0BM32_9EURY|nr:NOB1 family endonuclease [Archaeoglobus sulfaticallidus]AGK61651.1 putative nucleic acid-binding protein, consists of a PIN domain and a Zn-ribbon module [Archaeoglobus sulfaticallidus PM70-1]
MVVYVIDTSAIIFKKGFYKKMVTVPEVVEEVKDSNSSSYLSIIDLEVIEPDRKYIKNIERVARKTGDIYRLSETDIKLLALASELSEKEEVVLVTDDYSIQNVARKIGFKTDSIIQKGISSEYKWVRKCRGCKRVIKDDVDRCPVCGSELYLVRVK